MLLKFTKDKVVIQNIEKIDVIKIDQNDMMVYYVDSLTGKELDYDLSSIEDSGNIINNLVNSLKEIECFKEIDMSKNYDNVKEGLLYFLNINNLKDLYVQDSVYPNDEYDVETYTSYTSFVFDKWNEYYVTRFRDESELSQLHDITYLIKPYKTDNIKTIYESLRLKDMYTFVLYNDKLYWQSKFVFSNDIDVKKAKLSNRKITKYLKKHDKYYIKIDELVENEDGKEFIDTRYYNTRYLTSIEYRGGCKLRFNFHSPELPNFNSSIDVNVPGWKPFDDLTIKDIKRLSKTLRKLLIDLAEKFDISKGFTCNINPDSHYDGSEVLIKIELKPYDI